MQCPVCNEKYSMREKRPSVFVSQKCKRCGTSLLAPIFFLDLRVLGAGLVVAVLLMFVLLRHLSFQNWTMMSAVMLFLVVLGAMWFRQRIGSFVVNKENEYRPLIGILTYALILLIFIFGIITLPDLVLSQHIARQVDHKISDGYVQEITFSLSGDLLAYIEKDKLMIYDFRTQKLRELGYALAVRDLEKIFFSVDETTVSLNYFCNYGVNPFTQLIETEFREVRFDLQTGETTEIYKPRKVLSEQFRSGLGAEMSYDGTYQWVKNQPNELKIIDTRTGRVVTSIKGFLGEFQWAPNRNRIVYTVFYPMRLWHTAFLGYTDLN